MKEFKNNLKWIYLVFAFFVCHAATGQKDTTRVLFIGNSFTYFFNLPQVVNAMAETQGKIIITRQSTYGGSNLEQHWKNEKGMESMKKLNEGKWDYVILNNHSTSPIDNRDAFFEYGKKFVDAIKKVGAKPVFMMTWAYKSNPLMQKQLTDAYLELSKQTGAGFVPAGPLFEQVRELRPDMELFHDDKHPSSNGTYLLGLAFYKYFTKESTAKIPFRITTKDANNETLYLLFMNQEDVDFLQQLVDDFNFLTLK
jgi:hypothetical protein